MLGTAVSKQDVRAVADAIANEIVMYCMHTSGDPTDVCLTHHMEATEAYDMYVPSSLRDIYEKILADRKKTALLDRLVQLRLKRALSKLKRRRKL